MSSKRNKLLNRRQRAVLTDILPFEVPPTFSNRGFYRFLSDYDVQVRGKRLTWKAIDDRADVAIKLLFGLPHDAEIASLEKREWGKTFQERSVSRPRNSTIPFNFRVSHKEEGRLLTVIHPRNQIEVANFYAEHSSLILYHTSKSAFSIRKPDRVASYAYFKDKLHSLNLSRTSGGIEETKKEYEQLGSYFTYSEFPNIHRFFESKTYRKAETKYRKMMRIDVSRCFDSIYTHSVCWAIMGKLQAKEYLEQTNGSFAGKFDQLMSRMNHGETNGIIIGSEFSRIFAEVIMQAIDVQLRERLENESNITHCNQYEIFRYVDDFFIFYDNESTQAKVLELLQVILREYKLSINTAKSDVYEKPIITEMTIAKEQISQLFNDYIDPVIEESQTEPIEKKFVVSINLRSLIVRFKTIIKLSKVEYKDVLNYTFSIVEEKVNRTLRFHKRADRNELSDRSLIKALIAAMDFVFLVYADSPRVNHTIRVCRIISVCVDYLNGNNIGYDLKHLLFKCVHDHILSQLNRNSTTRYREVENLYLLIAMSHIGKEYWLPQALLVKYFGIEEKEGQLEMVAGAFLSHFSITVLLGYMRDKRRYAKLRDFVECHLVEKISHSKAEKLRDAEGLMLLLDVVTCPWVSTSTVTAAASAFRLDQASVSALRSCSEQWFTAWGARFRLTEELDAKRSREVY